MKFVIDFSCHNTIPAREQRHRDALAEARNQMSLNQRTPAEEAGEAAKVVRTMARNLREGREFSVTEQHQ